MGGEDALQVFAAADFHGQVRRQLLLLVAALLVATIRSEQPQPSQLDGDPIGDVSALRIRVDPGALLVRVPAVEPPVARPGHA